VYGGQFMAPAHPCLELWDRVHLHDSRACQAEFKRFVIGVETYFDTRGERGRFDQVVHVMRHVR